MISAPLGLTEINPVKKWDFDKKLAEYKFRTNKLGSPKLKN
jgi:hypothetical protein